MNILSQSGVLMKILDMRRSTKSLVILYNKLVHAAVVNSIELEYCVTML
jgi:hypothetical protein